MTASAPPDASGAHSILSRMLGAGAHGAKHVAIAGNMGVGKSTLTAALAERIGATAYYENVAGNPYLERFYEDMQRWSFHSQFTFLSQTFSQHCDILQANAVCVQDRTIYEHFHVFATSHLEQGLMSADEFGTLEEHFLALTRVVPGPDLMVYLRASIPVLVDRIRGRNRSIEANVQIPYLQGLEDRYERWMAAYDASDVLIIDTDNIDIHNADHREMLLSLIEERVAGRTAKAPFANLSRRRKTAPAPASSTAAIA
ncbi:MAG: Deoxyguanosine kinase / deoxyadenosine kinase subunit [Thermoleophilia bacterium]|nr:Deoxyguanosine kinase / deoxyadenosine kinase subunit [Thermoleophilia bacterium]